MERTTSLIIKETNKDFNFWLNSEFVSNDIRENLNNAAILLLPSIGQRRENEATFPSGTEAVYYYFKERIESEFHIDICISDEYTKN